MLTYECTCMCDNVQIRRESGVSISIRKENMLCLRKPISKYWYLENTLFKIIIPSNGRNKIAFFRWRPCTRDTLTFFCISVCRKTMWLCSLKSIIIYVYVLMIYHKFHCCWVGFLTATMLAFQIQLFDNLSIIRLINVL